MNFNAVNVVMFGVGAILVYSAIKDKNPKDVITDAFSSNAAASNAKKSAPQTANGSGPTHGNPQPQFAEPIVTAPVVTSN